MNSTQEITKQIISGKDSDGKQIALREWEPLAVQLAEALISETASSEPVAWLCETACVGTFSTTDKKSAADFNAFYNDGLDCHATVTPLYTHPSISLSDEDIEAIRCLAYTLGPNEFQRAVRAKLKGKEDI